MAGTRYYHVRNGVEQGPYSASQLKQLAQAGQIAPDDQVRAEGRDKLYPAHGVVGLFTPEQLAQARAAPRPAGASGSRPAAPAAAVPSSAAAPPPRGEDSPLVALLAAIVAVQRESLQDRVAQGRLTPADRDRQIGQLAALLERVRRQFPSVPQMPAAPQTPPVAPAAGVDGLTAAVGMSAAALAGGALGMALAGSGKNAPTAAPIPPAPRETLAPAANADHALAAARALNALRSWNNPAAASPPPAGLPNDVLQQTGSGGNWLHNPLHPPGEADGYSLAPPEETVGPAWNAGVSPPSPLGYEGGGGGDWGGLASGQTPVHNVAPSGDGSSGGGFFGALFGDDAAGGAADVDADGGWFGGGDDAADGLLDGAGDVDLGDGLDFDIAGGFDF